MNWEKEYKPLLVIVGVFLAVYYLPVGQVRFNNAVTEALALARWYAREHVLLCLIPAFFIAGAIAVFVRSASVIKYLGAQSRKVVAYSVASVSGSVLAVCSCTVLPLFAGIYRMGAGLGPAVAFLYSGPAINILAIILTARILGLPLGIARAVGAVVFSIVIGLIMHLVFRRDEQAKAEAQAAMPEPEAARPLWQTAVYFATMIAILVFATWARPAEPVGFWQSIYQIKWPLTGIGAAILSLILYRWFTVSRLRLILAGLPVVVLAFWLPDQPLLAFTAGVLGLSVITSTGRGETREWFESTWGFTKQILPLLFYGVLIAGALLGRPGHEGLVPAEWVANMVGGNSLWANLFASVAGAFMYFATLTEVPILQGLIGNGMGQGPALALLLAGPALSLPNMLVIRSVIGSQKTVVFVGLVIIMATISGMVFGTFF